MRTWRDIAGFEGRYQVSDDGFVRSLPDIDAHGRFMPGRILSAAPTEKGYRRVMLGGSTHRVHRLVAVAFIPNAEHLPQVNHKNGNKADNRASNLEWCDNASNQAHRYQVLGHTSTLHGKTGAACKNSKQVRGVRVVTGEALLFGSAAEAARILGITASGISSAARGELRQYQGYQWEYITRGDFDAALA